nr:gag-asp_proteas domain-containing protein [Ipomoea batatas]
MAQQRSGLHGHTADSTEATGGGKGAEHRDEAETSKLFERTGSVTGEVDGDVKDLWARVKELEALVHALQVAARDDIETLRAIAAADGLVDFAGSGSQGKDSNKNKGESGEGKSVSAGKSKRVETMAASSTGESRLKTGCWNCGGDHLRRNCPKKQTVNALKDVESNDDDSAPQRCSPLQLI